MTSLINILLIMTHTLPQLPYAEDALAPRMSKETIEYHHGKHQRTYVDNLNKLIAGTPYENMSLEEIIVRADGPIFNNAAQDWNHTFFFFTLSPTPKSMPSGPLAEAIENGKLERGIALCGSGEGMTMTLNKHQGIRAGLAWEPEIASLIRRHNNANIIVFPARFISNDEAVAMLDAYFSAQFEGGRHEHRIEKMAIPCCTAEETAK